MMSSKLFQERQVDLLQIDTEGADGKMLSLFPLERVRPAIIHWEVKHLSTAEREQCLASIGRFRISLRTVG